MKNILFTLVFVINLTAIYGQFTGGEIIYTKVLIDQDNATKNENVSTYLSNRNSNIQKILEDINFVLKFNETESYFYPKSLTMEVEEDSAYKLAVMIGGNSGEWYLNMKSRERLRYINAFGQDFIIKSALEDLKWKLTNESKQVGNFECFKATTTYVVINSKGTFNHPVEAWFTTEIPIGFGPIGYGGLPGLIVELNVRNVKYSISKVVLNPKKQVEIKKPTKGKLVTEEEFNTIGAEAMGNFKSKISN